MHSLWYLQAYYCYLFGEIKDKKIIEFCKVNYEEYLTRY